MSRQWIINLVLLAIVAVLTAILLLRPGLDQKNRTPITKIQIGDVDSIRIRQPAAGAILLLRRDNRWYLQEPFAARASDFVINNVLAVAGASSQWSAAYNEQHANRYGMGQPRLIVELGTEKIVFGDTNPLNQQQYLLYRDRVHLVSGDLRWSMPGKADQYLDRRLLATETTPVGIDFNHRSRLRLVKGNWSLTPANPSLTTDALSRLVNEWKYASALKVAPYQGAPVIDRVGIHYQGQSSVEVGILAREPELVLYRANENLQYHFSRGTADRLFPPQIPENDKRSTRTSN